VLPPCSRSGSKGRFAGRAPARLLLVQMATDRTVPENPGVAQRPAKKSGWCE
jgi:hypothetical protein